MKNETELQELVEAGLLTADQAEQIKAYWAAKPAVGSQRILVIFSLLGALLVGLGIILVVAHNWDQLGRLSKTILVVLPVLIGQAAAWYSIYRKPESAAWREGSGVFLTLSLGACLAMISQIYHIDGKVWEFLQTWIWLAFPIMYVLNSGLSSLLLWMGMTWYACDAAYWGYPSVDAWQYWLFALLALPFYYFNIRQQRPNSNYQSFHDWVIPLSLTICLGTVAHDLDAYLWMSYHLLLILFYVMGKYLLRQHDRILSNGWLVVGLIGAIVMLLIQSFRELWTDVPATWITMEWQGAEFFIYLLLNLLLLALLLLHDRRGGREWRTNPLCYLGLLIFVYYWVGWYDDLFGAILANIILLATGLYHIFLGTQRDHLGILNFGLLIITFQIACRFFDTDMTFALRGMIFLLLGAGFFAANSYIIRRRKSQES